MWKLWHETHFSGRHDPYLAHHVHSYIGCWPSILPIAGWCDLLPLRLLRGLDCSRQKALRSCHKFAMSTPITMRQSSPTYGGTSASILPKRLVREAFTPIPYCRNTAVDQHIDRLHYHNPCRVAQHHDYLNMWLGWNFKTNIRDCLLKHCYIVGRTPGTKLQIPLHLRHRSWGTIQASFVSSQFMWTSVNGFPKMVVLTRGILSPLSIYIRISFLILASVPISTISFNRRLSSKP